MAARILTEKAICAAINSLCTELSLGFKLDWDTLGINTADIIDTDVTIIFDGVVYPLNYVGYEDPIVIAPSDVGQTDTFSDGLYQISVTYTTATDTYSYSFSTATLCSIKCKINQLILQVANDPCLTCGDKKHFLYCVLADFEGLLANLACGNFTQFEFVLEQITDALANLNCNNC